MCKEDCSSSVGGYVALHGGRPFSCGGYLFGDNEEVGLVLSEDVSSKFGWTPSDHVISACRTLLGPWRRITSPRFLGGKHVPRNRPVLFIANHTLMGMLDAPLMVEAIYENTGHFPRAMGDRLHFLIPGWGRLLSKLGVVEGSREACRALMRDGHSILVYPGGGREVYKRDGEQYKLIWGNRTGFARLALEHGYPIVPVASVGAEECYKILIDHNDIAKIPLWKYIEPLTPRRDVGIPPLVYGLGGSPLPIPQRFYFSCAPLIESAPLQSLPDREEAICVLRDQVHVSLQRSIDELLRIRNAESPLCSRRELRDMLR